MHCSIKFCKVHHFAYDTNLMNFQASIKMVNKLINHDLKTYRIGLMLIKFRLISVRQNLLRLFHLERQLDHEPKRKLTCKKLYQTDSVKCLGIHLDK